MVQRTLRIVQTIEREGPGLLAPLALRRGWQVRTCRLWLAEPLPPLRPGDAVLLLGGPASANDGPANANSRIPELLDFSRGLLARQLPVLGICLGLQLLVKAGGGSVVPAALRELGWFDPLGQPWWLDVTAQGRHHPLLAGLPDPFALFQLHGEAVRPTSTMAVLAEGRWCRPQIVQVGPQAFGIQGHVELNGPSHLRWFREDPDLWALADRQLRPGAAALARLQPLGERLLDNWLDLAETYVFSPALR
ncbi:MAG: type 1 glutamine amidotransferase [Aphanocapsa feldmannii 277cV]|uniref:Type 1 glutamine amidotransferase n=2 Tax=Aphanocapsa feldmannii TaxID=192050 RepID=A0A524RKS2_9CHRO|nr:MAG: type 1 glutamine amidotransferase [Aphanocapsa feldmannii 277cV]TGH27865.1 MAG: type 1 glutamine amidotransferase [Aphanocapsa feldmannii 277cI]